MFKSIEKLFSCFATPRQDAKIATVMSVQYIYEIASPSLIGKLKNYTSLLKDYGATKEEISTFTERFTAFADPGFRGIVKLETFIEKRFKLLQERLANLRKP
jgi:hypothetical protein